MKSIKSKIRMIVLALLVVNSVLIGVITSLLNVKGIDRIMETTLLWESFWIPSPQTRS